MAIKQKFLRRAAARAYQIPMLIVIWAVFAEYSLRFVKTIES